MLVKQKLSLYCEEEAIIKRKSPILAKENKSIELFRRLRNILLGIGPSGKLLRL